MNILEFASGTEKMINPMDVGTTHHMQKKLCKLPRWIQRKIVTTAADSADKMGFVVEPYAFFLFYEIANPKKVQKYLPDNFEPCESSVFENDPPKFYGITSIFRVHTSAFWGARAEFYVVARDKNTGLMSWIILDYVSDTIGYDNKNGLRSPEASHAIITTTCEGDFLADIVRTRDNRRLKCIASLKNPKMRPLNEKLWIEGNTSIAYSDELSGFNGDLFSLTFLPREMKEAWEIPLSDVRMAEVSWFPAAMGGKLSGAACFPFAQHMLSDSPGRCTNYGSKAELAAAAEKINFKNLKTFSSK